VQKVWNIGNTTVRNPKRIESALKVFFDEGFSGDAKGSVREAAFHEKLKEKGVLDFGKKSSEWNGRKWRAAFYQLGFISFVKYKIENETTSAEELFHHIGSDEVKKPYEITKSGTKLINTTSVPEIEDIFIRQFACYEIPSALEHDFPKGRMKPFILFLEVLSSLQEQGHDGLDKYETGLFINRFRDHSHSLSKVIVKEILNYRKQLRGLESTKELKAFKKKILEDFRPICGIKPQSVVDDYADTTFRYFSLTGLFTRIGERFVIRENRREFVNKLLLKEPNFLYSDTPIDYFNKFYNNLYPIPTDEIQNAISDVQQLKRKIQDPKSDLLMKANMAEVEGDLEKIKNVRYELLDYYNSEREQDYAKEQQLESAIRDAIIYLRVLNNEKIDGKSDLIKKGEGPEYLEWAIWRCFLAINEIVSPVNETRGFSIDEDFFPRNPAPGGRADLFFEFEKYTLAVEATLTISHRQMSAEIEPVARHLVKYMQRSPKQTYCLFIAPSIDSNITERFRAGVWYDEKDEPHPINIVPMSISDFINAIEALLQKKITNTDFRTLLDRCLIWRNEHAPQWKKSISREVTQWKRGFV
jgi:hypothetical protein